MSRSSYFLDQSRGAIAPRYAASFNPGAVAPQPEVDDASFLLEYWMVLWRRRWTIALASLVTAALGLAVSMTLTPVYSGEAMLQIEGVNQNFMGLESLNPVAAPTGPINVYLPTQMQILESDSLVASVVDKMGLAERDEFQGEGLSTRLGRKLGLVSTPPLPASEVALKKARKKLSVEPIVQTHLVVVGFQSKDPELAAALPNALAQEFIRKNLELRRDAGKSTSAWLEEELHDQKRLLEDAENSLQTYARKNGLYFTGQAQESIAEDKMRQMQSELLRAEAEAAATQARFEAAVSSAPETLGEVLSDQSLRQKEGALTTLKQELAQTELWFKPNYPRVRELQAQIGEIESTLQQERANIVQRIENDYRTARRRADLLGAELERQIKVVSGESQVAVQYNILKREVETNRQVYDSLLQRMKEAGVAAAIQNSNITIVDAARVPLEPSEPNIPRNVLLGWLVGLCGAIGLVFVRDRADSTLRTPGDAETRLSLPELGVIPAFESDAPSRRLLGRGPAGVRMRQADEDPERALELVCWRREQSALAEAFQSTLTSVENIIPDGDSPRCLVVSSARAGEGKTTVLSNLGVAAAQRGRRVLLIDADLRAPRLHELFKVDNRYGLSNLLRAVRQDGETNEALVRPTGVDNLFVLPAGTSDASIPKLLGSPRVNDLLRSLEREFDLILIDTPPGLAVADARLLARLADGVLLVLRAGQTDMSSAEAVQRRFQGDGAAMIGAVLNGWNASRDGSAWLDPRDRTYYDRLDRTPGRV
ncbi:MAG: polysaccharide biosynthesis tyrosine autokinase [Acidobacteria bacterium]|nr:polysaccharide biosynthesis tyrosine autokinase [Acidobacteriota bacterium]